MSGIPGSKRTVPSGELSKMDAEIAAEDEQDVSEKIIRVTMVLRDGADADAVRQTSPTRVALREAHRPSLLDLEKVLKFVKEHNLEVVDLDRPPRMVVLRGTVGNIAAAFKTKVEVWQQSWPWPGEQTDQRTPFSFRLRPDEELQVPDELDGIVQGVFGIDNRKEARMQMWMQMWIQDERTVSLSESPGQPKSYTVKEVADIYEFPSAENKGHGQIIAVLSLGGRLDREELTQYCQGLGIEVPEVVEVPGDCAPPQLREQPNEDVEMALDVHVLATLVPCATIVIYYADNTSRGFINGLARAIYNESLPASIISISWGAYEESWTCQAICAIEDLLKDAKALNITVCCASGDLGSSDGDPDGRLRVDFPASSPYVLSCGGTTLTPGQGDEARPAETVWQAKNVASGGGQSTFFPMPDWQQLSGDPELQKLKMRGVPDVAGFADARNGFTISVSEKKVLVGGTSAVAPLWAGLIARINENLGKPVGFVNHLLYLDVSRKAFVDITKGGNCTRNARAGWNAEKGWDASTGLGRPCGGKLLEELKRLLP
jgi:kumamolisin